MTKDLAVVLAGNLRRWLGLGSRVRKNFFLFVCVRCKLMNLVCIQRFGCKSVVLNLRIRGCSTKILIFCFEIENRKRKM